MAVSVVDDMGRRVALARSPERIVSLVPSETETLFALGAGERLVGRTRYCAEPAGQVEDIPSCGGTRTPDVEAIAALRPELVIANQEENPRPALRELADRGIPVFISFPRRFTEAIAHVARLARLFEVTGRPEVVALLAEGYRLTRDPPVAAPLPVFVPIWKQPLMTVGGCTYGADMLACAGAVSVFAASEADENSRRLAARSPIAADREVAAAARYPEVTIDEVCGRAAEALLLPSEPYAFTEDDRRELAEDGLAAASAHTTRAVDGRDLFWYGARSPSALLRLRAIISELRAAR